MDLSEDALAVVHSGFLARATLDAIIDRVEKETKSASGGKETIARSSLARYRKWWRSEHRAAQQAQEYGREIAASLTAHPPKEQQRIVEQKLAQLMLLKLKELEADKPMDVAYLALAERKIRAKERQMELESRKVGVLEARLKQMQDAAKKAVRQIEREGKKAGLKKETITDIAEGIYGLAL